MDDPKFIGSNPLVHTVFITSHLIKVNTVRSSEKEIQFYLEIILCDP